MELPLIEAFKQDLYHCSDCNYCVDAVWEERGIEHVCPTMEHHTRVTSYTGRGYITAARAWREGVALDLNALGERVFTCSTCGNCETVCPIGLRPTQVARALRGELWTHNAVPTAARDLRDRMKSDGNPNHVVREQRMAWLAGLDVNNQATATIIYLPGCAAATAHPIEARAAHKLMTAAGYNVETLGAQDSCCGAPLFELGLTEEANFLRTSLMSKLPPNVEIVASGLECLQQWRRAGEVPTSFAEWILRALESGRLRLVAKSALPSVQIFDSCQSRNDQANSLRRVLTKLGVQFIESGPTARHVVCCGAAGGMPCIEPQSTAQMARARIHAAKSAIVGADVRCIAHIKCTNADAEIFGLAEFIEQAFRVL
jgi:Fe-S oxidoreductase